LQRIAEGHGTWLDFKEGSIVQGWLGALLLVLATVPHGARAVEACSPAKLALLRSPPLPGDGAVLIDCHLTLTPGEVITRSLYFTQGAVSNGVNVDCAGATLASTELNANLPRINIQSRSYLGGSGQTVWERPRDITIRHCTLLGNINVTGMGGQGSEAIRESSRTDPNHTQVLRERAPTNIVFDDLTIDPQGFIALYAYMGVTGMTVRNSRFVGQSRSVAIYLDAESGFNQILDNRFETLTPREVIAVDGSSDNRIQGNLFVNSPKGGIYLYRNCGEAGVVRHNEPARNDLFDNQFLDPGGPPAFSPHIWVGSRNGNRSYCDADAGYPFGSSVDNLDHAHFTAIKGNHFNAGALAVYLAAGPSYLIDNVATSAAALPAADGFGGTFANNHVGAVPEPSSACFWRASVPMLLADGEFADMDLANPQAAACAAQRLACQAGSLVQQPGSCDPARIVQKHFKCAVKGSDAGCAKALACSGSKRIQAMKARCNLESGGIDRLALAGAAWNSLAVDRASDVAGEGHCQVAGYDIASSATHLLGRLTHPLAVRCSEHDANGGDCRIEGDLVCY
jgi:parallel beta-helix repeat protein